jgi:hypothetical protein
MRVLNRHLIWTFAHQMRSLNYIRLNIRPRNLACMSFCDVIQIIPTIWGLHIWLHKALTTSGDATLLFGAYLHLVHISFSISITFTIRFILYIAWFLRLFMKSLLASKSLKCALIILNLHSMCSHMCQWWSLEAARLVLRTC